MRKARFLSLISSRRRVLGRRMSGVEEAEHEVRKFFVLPDDGKSCRRVVGKAVARARARVPIAKSARQFDRILNCHVQTLSGCGRDEMSGITDEEDATVLDRLGDQHSKIKNVAFDQSSLDERRLASDSETLLQFRPYSVVRPVFQSVGSGNLKVVAGHRRRAPHLSGEATAMQSVDRVSAYR